MELPSLVLKLPTSMVDVAIGLSPLVYVEMGYLGRKLFKFQFINLLDHLFLKGYPFLLCSVSLRLLIEGGSSVFSYDGWFEILYVEAAVPAALLLG